MTRQEIKWNAPDGAMHYKITMVGNIRYHTKDWNGFWGVYQNWKHPVGWKKVGVFFDDSDLKPLN